MDLIVAGDRAELAEARRILRIGREVSAGKAGLALVPTMGALHEGHRSLMRLARERADRVAVSIFVNPLQFGPGEDYSRYPRTFDADLEVCAAEGVDVVFAPAAEDLYLPDRQVGVTAGAMGTIVEGASRPGHFDGMLTVVLKLFNLVRPDAAVFGRKDAQQLALIRRMALDLDLPIEIVGAPTIREADGLALSSRNRYLSAEERSSALALSRALFAGAEQRTPEEIRRAARAVLDAEPGAALDYLVLVDPATFTEVSDDHAGEAVLAVAAKVGTTRLIDNVVLTLGRP
ncbi:pantoate--beta-alanine ligase [Planomonospora parontospora]|uniref:pantoate--beta-alanine ligase n=1 Tax=Planomonospora parontospora TaxID=58119 RepID=UPI00166F9BD6|nr:pantoate--beta-alanine ligase [Planomonospora parontospora]GGL28395.1 pantothenate synthetase [Planomonospora parontospora subsp. antibiotica]GII18033.1 pantothenate synthetase [Planomonospora parontospora subsp. antibiotica]